jgi:transcriptional regulator with XRE-family HTH domain
MMIQEKLRNLRKLKNMSQQEMAKIIGTDASNYSRKERGEVRIFDDE